LLAFLALPATVVLAATPSAILSFEPFPKPGESLNPTITTGTTLTFIATLSNAQSGEIWVMKGNGSSSFPCPKTLHQSGGKYYCNLTSEVSSYFRSSYTFGEPGTYTVMVNAFSGTGFNSAAVAAAGASARCSGNPSLPAGWSSCDVTDSGSPVHDGYKIVTVTNPVPPAASLNEGSRSVRVGETLSFHATLSGSATSGDIYIAKGDASQEFYCPGGLSNLTQREKGLWCKIGPAAQADYKFMEKGTYTVVINAYNGTYNGTASTGCSGNPLPYGTTSKNEGQWSDCGGRDNIAITAVADPISCTITADKTTIERGKEVTFTAYSSSIEGQNDPRVKRMILAYTYPALATSQPASPGITKWITLGNMATQACVPGENCQVKLNTSSLPEGASDLTVACSAFMNDSDTPFSGFYGLDNSCTGHPWAAGATADKPWTSTPSEGNPGGGVNWASCGSKANVKVAVVSACEKTGNFSFQAWKDSVLALLAGTSKPIPDCPGTVVTKANALKLFNALRRKAVGYAN